MYNDKLIYKVVMWVFLGGYFMKIEVRFNSVLLQNIIIET